jgi:uncharacterized protein involved in exopolysaccharide biosynthesis
MDDQGLNLVAATKARALLIILMATCRETLTALDAVGNVLDTSMTEDLRRMIERSEGELAALTARIENLR